MPCWTYVSYMKLKSDKYTTGQKALTKKEFEKLIEVIDNYEDELLIKLAVTTGLRREDLCDIKISNIDIDNKTLLFHESKKSRDRTIHLPDQIIVLIKKFLKTIPKRENLFSFTGRTAYRHFNYWCTIASIPERPIHALRATCIKFCQSAKWTPEQVSELTGDTIAVIQQHYSTPTYDEMRSVTSEKPII
jgi:integrase